MSDPIDPGQLPKAMKKPKSSEGLTMFFKALVAFAVVGTVLAMLAFGACILMLKK